MKEKDPFDFERFKAEAMQGLYDGKSLWLLSAVNEASVRINDGWRTGKPLERRESFGQ